MFLPYARLILLLLVAACTALPPPQEAASFPMLDDGKVHQGVQKAIVVIPGALASVGIFRPVLNWQEPDSAVIAYRYPGMDGLELDHRVDIELAGQLIADTLNRIDAQEVYMIGYSTGGPVALEAAKHLKTRDISIAMLSSASDSPAAIVASLKGFRDVVTALLRADGKSMADAWAENYRTLLYGRDHYANREQAARSAQLAKTSRPRLTTPAQKLTMAHTADLLYWRLQHPEQLSDVRIGFFHGGADSVFSVDRTRRFAGKVAAEKFYIYDGQGHLLFITSNRLWDDIRRFFFDGKPAG
ncbi:alpha/beta fold hydrolase [Pseudooceanicola aestuarii]|uniref:alpha/beta fold hydrolase n=1 Tax=Pseudooceanicola aestuarii TaxID=2697319 RepID=UPI0013D88DD0|nr:alpha/beta hydrolase [Pseudooceanicola aestuarii]